MNYFYEQQLQDAPQQVSLPLEYRTKNMYRNVKNHWVIRENETL